MSRQTDSSPFARAVVTAMRKLYPESLADKSFDNTGLLLESPFEPQRRQKNSVLLTIDLTKAVADEAISRGDSVIVAYHPIIFRGLKSITLANSQQKSLLRLAAEGISVYSPHTAVDAAPGGLGDWLADIVTGTPLEKEIPESDDDEPPSKNNPQPKTPPSQTNGDDPFVDKPKRPTYQLQHHPSRFAAELATRADDLSAVPHTRHPIVPSSAPGFSPNSGAGTGRLIRFSSPQTLVSIIDRIGSGLGSPKGFPVAIPQGVAIEDVRISSVALCAGSGGDVFAKVGGERPDLLFTGELSHHEALAAIEKGQCVISLFHSNTERGFLHDVLRGQLQTAVEEEWAKVRAEEKDKGLHDDEWKEILSDEEVEVHVSEVDRDPYGIVIAKED